MDGERKTAAAKNMISGLYELGYINDKEKRMLEYRLQAGEREVFENIRAYLIRVINEITK